MSQHGQPQKRASDLNSPWLGILPLPLQTDTLWQRTASLEHILSSLQAERRRVSLEAATAAPIPLLLTQPLLELRQQLEFVAHAPPYCNPAPVHHYLPNPNRCLFTSTSLPESAPSSPRLNAALPPLPPPTWRARNSHTIRRSKSACRHSSASSAQCSRRLRRSMATVPSSTRVATRRLRLLESRLPRNLSIPSTLTLRQKQINCKPRHPSTHCFSAQLCRRLQ